MSDNLEIRFETDIHTYIKYFLHKVQLHVSALYNGHLQVVYEILIKQLFKTYMDCLYGVGRG